MHFAGIEATLPGGTPIFFMKLHFWHAQDFFAPMTEKA